MRRLIYLCALCSLLLSVVSEEAFAQTALFGTPKQYRLTSPTSAPTIVIVPKPNVQTECQIFYTQVLPIIAASDQECLANCLANYDQSSPEYFCDVAYCMTNCIFQ